MNNYCELVKIEKNEVKKDKTTPTLVAKPHRRTENEELCRNIHEN